MSTSGHCERLFPALFRIFSTLARTCGSRGLPPSHFILTPTESLAPITALGFKRASEHPECDDHGIGVGLDALDRVRRKAGHARKLMLAQAKTQCEFVQRMRKCCHRLRIAVKRTMSGFNG